MTVLAWDKSGEKFYEMGVDRGVLYPKNSSGVVWNGLVSLEDATDSEIKSFYLDGIKFLNRVIPGDYSGKLNAFTYPDEFEKIMGTIEDVPGLLYHDQPGKSFNLSYRTKVGNDVEGPDYSYKIHLLFNLVASLDSNTFSTNAESISINPFSWSLTGTPVRFPGKRPTVHISIDSNDMDAELLQTFEDVLYGTDTTEPRFPSVEEIGFLVSDHTVLVMKDLAGHFFDVTITFDGTIDVSLNETATSGFSEIIFSSPDSTLWSVTPFLDDLTLDCTLNIEETSPDSVAMYSELILVSDDDTRWILNVDDTGYLNIVAE